MVKIYAVHQETQRRVLIEQNEDGQFSLTCQQRHIMSEMLEHGISTAPLLVSWGDAVNEAELHLEHWQCEFR